MNHKLEVFDPPMCCSSGVCGSEVDPKLVEFSAALKALEQQGHTVTRHNMAQEPMAFVQNETVRAALQQDEKCLPLILLNGKIITTRTYPSSAMLAAAIAETEE
jgi:hypothetical protein